MNNDMDDHKTHSDDPRSPKLQAMHLFFHALLATVGCLFANVLIFQLSISRELTEALINVTAAALLFSLGLGLRALFLPGSTTATVETATPSPQTAEASAHALARQRQAEVCLFFNCVAIGGWLLVIFSDSYRCDFDCLFLLAICIGIGLIPTVVCLGAISYWRLSRTHGQEASINPTLTKFLTIPVLVLLSLAGRLLL